MQRYYIRPALSTIAVGAGEFPIVVNTGSLVTRWDRLRVILELVPYNLGTGAVAGFVLGRACVFSEDAIKNPTNQHAYGGLCDGTWYTVPRGSKHSLNSLRVQVPALPGSVAAAFDNYIISATVEIEIDSVGGGD